MRNLNNKVILVETKKEEEGVLIYEDKDEVKLGKAYLPFKGEKIELKKGDEVYYQYGQEAKLEGQAVVLVNESNLVCQK